MTVINARVEAEDVRAARRVLEREGRTMSWAVRIMVEYIARTGELPPLTTDEGVTDSARIARETIEYFESLPFVEPPEGWGDVALDRQIIGEERMRRFDEKAYATH